ncbi:MAG: rhomboid family intramembrane serine protease [bacterium]|nr:rhomboid family intramembrane serine protease [bacterium]
MERFPVDFRRNFYPGESSNSFRLSGPGELELNSAITLRARQRSFLGFSKKTALHFDPAQVVNVERKGQSLRFDLLAGGDIRNPGHLCLLPADEAAAQRLAALLPATRTDIVDQAEQELDDFRDRLYQATPHAFVTPTLVVVNLLIFAAMVATGVDMLQPDGRMVISWGANFGPYTTNGQWWRLLSSMFLHFGILHVGLNMWALYYSGRVVERLFGNGRFALLYLIAGLSGSIASLLWNPMVNSAGASGAIFGVYGALLAFMLDRRNQVPKAIMKEQRLGVLIFILYSLGFGLRQEGIDNAAHIGGLAGGLIMGWFLARPLNREARAQPGRPKLVALVTAATITLTLLTLPIERTGEAFRREEQFFTDFRWLSEEETRLSAASEEWRQLAATGMHSWAYLADKMEEDIVHPWQGIYERLSANMVPETSRLRSHQDLVLRSVRERRDGYQLFVEGIRTNDEDKLQEAQVHFAASNETIKRLQQLSAEEQ